MPLETWADRADYTGMPAAPMRCPCCGKMRTADSIVRLPDTRVRARAAARFHAESEPEYVCTAALETLKREKIVSRAELPTRTTGREHG